MPIASALVTIANGPVRAKSRIRLHCCRLRAIPCLCGTREMLSHQSTSQISDLRYQVDRLDDAITEIQASMRIFHAISSRESQPKLPCASCTGSVAVGNYLDPCGSAPQSTQKGGLHVLCSPYSNANEFYVDPVCSSFNISASVQELGSTHDPGTNSQPSDASHRVLSTIFPESIKPHQATIRLERTPTLAGSATHSPGLADDSPCIVAEPEHLSGAYLQEHQLVSGPAAWGHLDGIPGHSMYFFSTTIVIAMQSTPWIAQWGNIK